MKIEGETGQKPEKRIKRFKFNSDGAFGHHLSLVDDGANNSEILLVKTKEQEIIKSHNWKHISDEQWMNAKEQVFICPVLIPNTVDHHNETYSEEAVADALRSYLENDVDDVFALNHGENISTGPNSLEWIDHWLTAKDITTPAGTVLPKGSWLAEAKVHNTELWEAIKQGVFSGLSIKSTGVVEDIEMEKKKDKLRPIAGKIVREITKNTGLAGVFDTMFDAVKNQAHISQTDSIGSIKNYDDYLNDELAEMGKGQMSAVEAMDCLYRLLLELPMRQTNMLLEMFIQQAEVMAQQPYQSGSATAAIEDGAADFTPQPPMVEKKKVLYELENLKKAKADIKAELLAIEIAANKESEELWKPGTILTPKGAEYLIAKEKAKHTVEKAAEKKSESKTKLKKMFREMVQEEISDGMAAPLARNEVREKMKSMGYSNEEIKMAGE